ncbi:hypothetical protein HGA92_03370 [Candidatus Gracilibacteria bacterium]|nr:hypothetical protein [Candidatus Gracilibacteria bacterium]NUJ99138.1 hypothetical protein [Candidatus Gracilibacteria bacterium]
MKNIQKLFLVGIVSSLLIFQNTFAGGGGIAPTGYTDSLKNIADLVKDSETKKIITDNIVSIISNNIQENSDYNIKNFYTKKLKLNVEIPEALKAKIQKAYIGLGVNQQIYYDGMGGGEGGSQVATPLDVTEGINHIKIELKTSEIPGEVLLQREIFNKYIANEYGDSFMGTLYLELMDGTTIPFSNSFYIYIQANTNNGKGQHLQNLYYQENSYNGYANIYDLLKAVFEKIKVGKTTNEYIAVLEKAIDKANEKMKAIESAQKKVTDSIQKEEDFAKFIRAYGATVERFNLLNDIKYNIGSEIKTKQSEGLIEEIFG